MTVDKVRIGVVTHRRLATCWGKDERGCVQHKTPCGVLYTLKSRYEGLYGVQLGRPAEGDVDCMTCLVRY